MPELPSSFWGGWIIVLTLGSLALLVGLVFSVYFFDRNSEDAHDTVWDETLREGNHPAPLWWFWLLITLLTISVIYLLLYPGLGRYRGALEWSQGHQLAHSRARYELEFSSGQKSLLRQPYTALAKDERAMATAQSLFRVHCGSCHGDDARGIAGQFPDLRDAAWQWGGSAEQISATISHGRTAAMPAWRDVLGREAVANLAQYVAMLSQTGAVPENPPDTSDLYQANCSACHGADGSGNPLLGAPDLTDSYWLYGGSREAIESSIAFGRHGEMPSYTERLNEVQIRLLTTWLLQHQ